MFIYSVWHYLATTAWHMKSVFMTQTLNSLQALNSEDTGADNAGTQSDSASEDNR